MKKKKEKEKEKEKEKGGKALRFFIKKINLKKKDEGTTLIELMVTMAITSLVMLGLTFLISGVLSFVFSTNANAGNISSASVIAKNVLYQLEGAQPLGACNTDATQAVSLLVNGSGTGTQNYTFTTPYANCYQYTTYGSPYYSYSPTGFCFYSYTYQKSTTGSAPQLECFYQDTASNRLYLTTWAPITSATYTTCSPSNCWTSLSGVAPPAPGATPSSVIDCSAKSSNCITYDLGKLVTASNASTKLSTAPNLFSYVNSQGQTVSSDGGSLPVVSVITKVDIYVEDDSASAWLGSKKYQVSFYAVPKGNGLNAVTWNNKTS